MIKKEWKKFSLQNYLKRLLRGLMALITKKHGPKLKIKKRIRTEMSWRKMCAPCATVGPWVPLSIGPPPPPPSRSTRSTLGLYLGKGRQHQNRDKILPGIRLKKKIGSILISNLLGYFVYPIHILYFWNVA